KDPRDRYQSAASAAADLDELAAALREGDADPAVAVGAHDPRRTLTEPAFVGRAHELEALEGHLTAARGGRGGLGLLAGESGGGKTRMLDELARRCALRAAWVLRGQGRDRAGLRPFQVLEGVVRELVSHGESDRLAALRERLGDRWEAACSALPQLASRSASP